jgi:UDP-N-acetylmuramate-alanine ligase
MDDAAEMLRGMLGEGDMLITLGAGNVDQVAAALTA